jgi:hypothetical protein
MKIIYKNVQYGILITVIFLLIMVFSTYGFIYQTGVKPLPLIPYIILMILFVVILVNFYKLTIVIDSEKITAAFGIGFLKKTMKLNEIKSIENYKIPWYTGIGIRLTPKGWLWNVKTGNAILLKSKTKTFLVGSNEVEKLIKIVNEIK